MKSGIYISYIYMEDIYIYGRYIYIYMEDI